MISRQFIHVTGIVQGVGFRPFVYQLALEYQLLGWVINDSEGVKIDAQGTVEQLTQFVEQLERQAPPLSRIDHIEITVLPSWNKAQCPTEFSIQESCELESTSVSISPDQGVCQACLADLEDPRSRYYHYPFTNCTHCGPRYSIIKALPYDRCHTSMANFQFCQPCEQAYKNPLDRRYHAQPISCEHCGPWVSWHQYSTAETDSMGEQAIESLAKQILAGGVVALKGLGGFHLICDASDNAAVERLRQYKHRPKKPLAIMVQSLSDARVFAQGCDKEWQTLDEQKRPIVLFKKNRESILAPNLAPNVPYLGIMLPYTPLHFLLFAKLAELKPHTPHALVMTSANRSGLPIATCFEEVIAQFGTELDGILNHNRPILHACDDSLVHVIDDKVHVLRMARGYAPFSRFADTHNQATLAMGAQQKASIGLALPQQWMLSPFIGDLDNVDNEMRYQEAIKTFTSLYHVSPQRIVCDYHPGYRSTELAQRIVKDDPSISLTQIQHHYAHVLAVMAEHHLTEQVLGFTFDGTGYGEDETVWGGEVLLADTHNSKRVASLRSFRLLGGEQAIKEPARLLLAILLEFMPIEQVCSLQEKLFPQWTSATLDNLYQLWQSGSRSPYTSSMGRLIDAMAYLLGLLERVSYEGEAGLLLEQAALNSQYETPYPLLELSLVSSNTQSDFTVIDWQPCFESVLSCRLSVAFNQTLQNRLAHAFLRNIAQSIFTLAENYPALPLVLSGGVFQNRIILQSAYTLASARDSVLQQKQPIYSGELIPVNDGGIAAGQLWYAIHNN
ncbi:carbamoyltransferase HypF [Photobacterium damselae subsp. piscicida]|nr:carbamoyltransferase HypF [Photobacterium damselae]MBE8127450.1 carbamoyltransferase HypF [Photobacterium damselae subsp. piscicida]PSW78694.1 carbamoyltransferase HypF [Photobacterium damselae]QOD54998.1 carbamoyltransferase HypF [Photobacterium damselae subsp. piscicida]QOD58875.1 carbamoyltransferase HypF [Photobacterium damselae subsp. piscicida]